MCVLSGARLFKINRSYPDYGCRPAGARRMIERVAASMGSSMKRLPGDEEQPRRCWPALACSVPRGRAM
jgi:hypothetical protein